VCNRDSETAAYAQAACLRVHAALLSELSARIAPVPTDEADPWERIARELEPPGVPAADEERAAAHRAANDGWDAAEKALAEDSAS
jgi:hypothetical protein